MPGIVLTRAQSQINKHISGKCQGVGELQIALSISTPISINIQIYMCPSVSIYQHVSRPFMYWRDVAAVLAVCAVGRVCCRLGLEGVLGE